MPQLPSGKHIALDPSPLQKLLDEVSEGLNVHELMEIESVGQLFSRINVLYLRSSGSGSRLPLAKFSVVPPENLEPYPSGFNLVSIQGEVETWDVADQKAFITFLNEERTNAFFENILDTVRTYQEKFTEHPDTLQGLLALWWKLGVHPLQEGYDDF